MVERVELARLVQEIDPAEGHERGRLDVEPAREVDVLHERGRGVEVEVLGPAAVEVRVLDVVGRGDDVRVERAGEREEVVFGDGVWNGVAR